MITAERAYLRSEMLPASAADIVRFPRIPPKIICVVDAEEEFDWNAPFAVSNNAVTSIKAQSSAQAIFRRFNLLPTYVVDYPVAAQKDGYQILREFLDGGQCEIGAQLHPWVTPPQEETVNEKNSFACNLPYDLQRRKMEVLTATIRQNFGIEPKVFRTGRYGAGADTVRLLQEFGYEIDCSVLPGPAITPSSPDYSYAPARPYWLGSGKRILEIPVTAGITGTMRYFKSTANLSFTSSMSRLLRIPAFLARFGLRNSVRISPERYTLQEAKNLTLALLCEGQCVFTMSYHSPSLEPGRTPYTQNRLDVERFLEWIQRYLEFFIDELGGTPSTPAEILELARRPIVDRSDKSHPSTGGLL